MKIPEYSNGRALEGNPTVTEGAPRVATGNTTSLPALTLPSLSDEVSAVDAALAYAEAGWYVGPVRPGTKHPGSILGDGWQGKTSRDPEQIRAWYEASPDAGVFLHVGRSGALVFDVDHPEALPERLWRAIERDRPPHQRTRADQEGRGHYLFALPAGSTFGNSQGDLGTGWGEVRGTNGVIIAAPSIHPDAGGCYSWAQAGSLPILPVELVEALAPATRKSPAPVGEAGRHAAFARELVAVLQAKPGERNNRLNEAAYNLGQLAGPAGLDEGLVRAALVEAGQSAGLDPHEVAATVESGLRSGQANARPVSATDDPDRLEVDVAAELRRIEVRETARARWRAAQDPHLTGFDAGTLGELLGREPEPRPRVEGLIPWEASTLISAQRKTGKTTLVLNLAKALLTGEAFLGFDTVPIAGKVALLNFEVSGFQIARWANEMRVPHDRLVLVNLRGRRNALADERDREALAAMLRAHQVESLIVDPFGRAFAGESQNDAGQVGRFLVDLDRFARSMVQARDLILTAHAGWNGERTRGSSALEDWADVIVTMTRSESESNPARYLRATGRDVDLDEDQLAFDQETRTLTLTGQGSRKQQQRRATSESKVDEQMQRLVALVTERPGLIMRDLRGLLKGSREVVDAAVAEAHQRGLITTRKVGNATMHFPAAPQAVLPDA